MLGDTPLQLEGGHGLTGARLRSRNERAILTALRNSGLLASAEIAKTLDLSAQTASVITRSLAADGLLQKEDPVKGKVGKPQTPFSLSPDGAFAFGLLIGRRGADLVMMDLTGGVRQRRTIEYPYPTPQLIEDFALSKIAEATATLKSGLRDRVVGLCVAAPFELWNWLDGLGAPKDEAESWRGYDLQTGLSEITGLSVSVFNDVNLACNAELVFGAGSDLSDFAYFFVGSFIGGGIVLRGQVFHGANQNAGALGSIPVGPVDDPKHQLIHQASLYTLERMLADRSGHPVNFRSDPSVWNGYPDLVDLWIDQTARAIAQAAVSVIAVLDVSTVVVDGGFPPNVRSRLVEKINVALPDIDRQGLRPFRVIEGRLGRSAGALGAAYVPLQKTYFLEGRSLS